MAQARYQYGTSPRKIEPDDERRSKKAPKKGQLKVVKELPKQQIKLSKEQRSRQMKMTVTVVGLFLLLLTISCRNSQIDKKFDQIQDQKKQLATLQKENEQLKVSIENSLNLNSVAKAAEDKLGMQKLDNNQKIYLNLQKKDYVESASEDVVINDNMFWFDKLLQKLTQIIK